MKLRLFWYQNLYFFTNVAYHCFPPTHSIILDIIRRNKLLLFGHILSHDRWSTGKDGIAWLSRRWTTERKTTEEMDTQHHGMDWTDIMWGCSTVTGSCNMEQDRIWPNGLWPINVKINCRFKYTCNDDAGIGRRKQQKLVYRIFTCKFPVSSLQCHDLLTLQRRDRKFTCENTIH